MATCYRCAMVSRKAPDAEATTTRGGKPVCAGHAAEADGKGKGFDCRGSAAESLCGLSDCRTCGPLQFPRG